MKYLPLIVMTAALGACATQPAANVQSVGESQQPAAAVAQCIAHKWADKSQQQIVSQDVLANGQAVDVYVPGAQPPNGAAATVRPSRSGKSTTWVGFRSSGTAGGDAAADINACL
ncbi:hypothetical protein [Paraburkholderia haematera]|uniref:Lipoprotein n=1 Tax=Paraburkholderia haematera TaxID=2793077 RepID=A0ABN7MED5_9BURK|nr:hypothetical protein [Paraburkholderia haematera]CAE6801771.1 hypothetical protein R69888_05243 [Paraburkholderia haematera]